MKRYIALALLLLMLIMCISCSAERTDRLTVGYIGGAPDFYACVLLEFKSRYYSLVQYNDREMLVSAVTSGECDAAMLPYTDYAGNADSLELLAVTCPIEPVFITLANAQLSSFDELDERTVTVPESIRGSYYEKAAKQLAELRGIDFDIEYCTDDAIIDVFDDPSAIVMTDPDAAARLLAEYKELAHCLGFAHQWKTLTGSKAPAGYVLAINTDAQVDGENIDKFMFECEDSLTFTSTHHSKASLFIYDRGMSKDTTFIKKALSLYKYEFLRGEDMTQATEAANAVLSRAD